MICFSGQMTTKPFATRVIEAIAAKKISAAELSRMSGVSYDIINKLKQRPESSTNADAGRKLAAALGIEWDGDVAVTSLGVGGNTDFDLVNVYDVQAGAGGGVVVYDEEAVGQLAFPRGYLRGLTRANPDHLGIISVKGDSMLPTLADDDVVMVDRSKCDLSYDGLFVIRDGGDALLVKRIGRASQRGFVTIISDNRNIYPSVEKSLQDIEVVGRVIWRGGKV